MGDETQPTVGESAGYSGVLSEFAGPYVSEMLGKGAALADMPYNAYTGPLTAGSSALQDQAFAGYGALDTSPTTGLGSFSAMGAPAMGGLGSFQPQPQPFFGQPQPAIGMIDNDNSRFRRDIQPFFGQLQPQPARGDVQISPREMQPADPRLTGGMDFMEFVALPVEERLRIRQEGLDAIAAENPPLRQGVGEPALEPTWARLNDALLQKSPQPRPQPPLLPQVAMQQQQPSVAAQYMNPYLQAALDPQLREARRQADVSRIADASRLTKAGAFGGSRQAIMESEGRRNLGQLQSDITAKGYADAFEKARSQFNTEEDRRIAAEEADRRYGLSALRDMSTAGATQRDIEQEGITADYLQFEKERKYPYEQLAFQQSLLNGLPIAARQESYIEPSGYSTTAGGLNDILRMLSKFGIGALA